MAAYKFVKNLGRNFSSRSRYGYGSAIKGITIHHWGSDGQKHANVVAWLRGVTGNRGSSAHYVVSDDLVTQLVEDKSAAWHAGNNRGNGTTIGIECRPEMSDGDWSTLVELCADLERKHGSLKYYRHKDWKNTDCPGRYSNRIEELVKEVNATLRGEVPARKPPKKPGKKPSTPPPTGYPLPRGHYYYVERKSNKVHSGYWKRDRAAIRKIQSKVGTGIDGGYGDKTKAAVLKWQRKHGLKADGAVGADTWREMFA